MDLACVLPCQICVNAYLHILHDQHDTIKNFQDQNEIFDWTVNLHNEINQKLKKHLFTHDEARNRYLRPGHSVTTFDPVTLLWDLLAYDAKTHPSFIDTTDYFDKAFQLFLQPNVLSYFRYGWKTNSSYISSSSPYDFVSRLMEFYSHHPSNHSVDVERESHLEIEVVMVLRDTEEFRYTSMNDDDPVFLNGEAVLQNTDYSKWPIVDGSSIMMHNFQRRHRITISSHCPLEDLFPAYLKHLCSLRWRVNVCLYEAEITSRNIIDTHRNNEASAYRFAEPCGIIKKKATFLYYDGMKFQEFDIDKPFHFKFDVTLEACYIKRKNTDMISITQSILTELSVEASCYITYVHGFVDEGASNDEIHHLINTPIRSYFV